jgi:hypothetical protein
MQTLGFLCPNQCEELQILLQEKAIKLIQLAKKGTAAPPVSHLIL